MFLINGMGAIKNSNKSKPTRQCKVKYLEDGGLWKVEERNIV